jgi:glycosyltransferase involved in cell wall biosynthesis
MNEPLLPHQMAWPPNTPHAEARDRALRILTVGNMYPPHHAGGYEFAWQRAVHHARSLGHQVRVLVTDYHTDEANTDDDPDVHRTLRWYWDLDHYEFPRLNAVQRLGLERHNATELRRHLKEFRPDLIAWWSMGCMSLSLIEQARRVGLPAVFVVHDDWLGYGWEHDQWIRMWQGPRRGRVAPVAERILRIPTRVEVNRAGCFVFNSNYTLQRAREVRLTTPRVSVVHPGIDETFLEPLEQQPWHWRLAYVGRVDRQKGIDTAVKAVSALPPETTLTVWGSGDDRYIDEMRRLSEQLGLADRVQFKGFVESSQLRAAYAAADAVVFPVRWNEPFGLVPLEAMGVQRPVVTTSTGGISEFVRNGENAMVFAVDDSTAMADCITRLARDRELRNKLRAGGVQTARRFTASRSAERTVSEMLRAMSREVPETQSRP